LLFTTLCACFPKLIFSLSSKSKAFPRLLLSEKDRYKVVIPEDLIFVPSSEVDSNSGEEKSETPIATGLSPKLIRYPKLLSPYRSSFF
jgi:hypothetical protein